MKQIVRKFRLWEIKILEGAIINMDNKFRKLNNELRNKTSKYDVLTGIRILSGYNKICIWYDKQIKKIIVKLERDKA